MNNIYNIKMIDKLKANDLNHDFVVKTVLVGDSSVGKTNLLMRFTENKFSEEKKPTMGVEFGATIMTTNDKLVKVQVWDTAGQEKYKSITNSYYINAKGALVIFDLARKQSFDSTEKWIKDLKDVAGKDCTMILVGNKNDLVDQREVSLEECNNKAESFGLQYMETSALNGNNVKETFQLLADSIYKNYLSNINMNDEEEFIKSYKLTDDNKDKKDDGCKC